MGQSREGRFADGRLYYRSWSSDGPARGEAIIAEGAQVKECQAVHFEKHPKARRYAFDDTHRCIRVSPRWIKYRDGSMDPDEIFEFTF